MSKFKEIKWLEKVEEHDFPAAEDFLALVCHPAEVKKIMADLKHHSTTLVYKKAKDIFRSSRLPVLGEDNFHVKKNMKKVDDEEKLSPVILVVDRINRILLIADGYHRCCTSYIISEDSPIPCQIAYI